MRSFVDALARRRAALVERSAARRAQVAAAAAGVQQAAAQPLLLGLGVAATFISWSPKLRGWLVKAWATYAFVRRLLDR